MSLRVDTPVVVHLKPPPVVRAQVGSDGVAFKGNTKAAVTIVGFTDFHCPFCKRAQGARSGALRQRAGEILAVSRQAFRHRAASRCR